MSLQAQFDELELQKERLLADFDSLFIRGAAFRPSPEAWSALEVLDHLVKTEAEILGSARAGVSRPHRIGMLDVVRTRFVQAIFRSERRVKVPAAATVVLPGKDLELGEIAARWIEGRRDLKNFIAATAGEKLRTGIFRHPVAGWMGMPQILDFFSVHITHHRFQLARLRVEKGDSV